MAIGALVLADGGTTQQFTTVSPHTFAVTPSSAARAIWIAIVQIAGITDTITAVSYGGVALTRIDRATDSSGELAGVEHWFLGSGIPAGSQTVSISHGGLATTKWPVVLGYAAAADTRVVTFGKLEGNQADPEIALDSGAVEAIRVCALFSGLSAVTDVAILTGMSAQLSGDQGSTITRVDRQTTNSTGSFTIGYDAPTDDMAMVAAALAEVGVVLAKTDAIGLLDTGTVDLFRDFDPLGLTDSLVVDLSSPPVGGSGEVSQTDPLGLSDSLVLDLVAIHSPTLTDALGLTDSLEVDLGSDLVATAIDDALGLTDSILADLVSGGPSDWLPPPSGAGTTTTVIDS